MAGRIPESFIEELINRVDVVDVISPRVPLKKAGAEYSACCPFHDEKTPSFTVSPQKQFYHCFGCGAHGTAIGFLMAYDGLEFVDAVEELARSAGLEVPREDGGRPQVDNSGLYELVDKASQWFQARLRENPEAIEYLRQRGVSGEIARDFGIGYAPLGWGGLIKALGSSDSKLEQMLTTGLTAQGDKGVYDKFRQRIMFPIHDRRGRVIAFGGRALADKGPKYLNSPETPLFHKGRELYGLFRARKIGGQLERLLVVEGYMDVVALAQFGIQYAVATLGTATTAQHSELLFRNAPEVVFCFDGDRAGRKAAWRALENVLPVIKEGRQARFLFLPDGEDPDSLIRKEGEAAFVQRIQTAKPLSAFFFERMEAQTDMTSVEGRARLSALAQAYLEKIPEGVLRDMLLTELRQRVGHQIQLATSSASPVKKSTARLQKITNSPIRIAIALVLQTPKLAVSWPKIDELQANSLKGLDLLREIVDFCASRPDITTAGLLEQWREHPAGAHMGKLAADDLLVDDKIREVHWQATLGHIALQVASQRLEPVIEQQRQGVLTVEQKELLRQLLARKLELQQKNAATE
ncbi:MAG: DNA primase [Xanthomonadales bacterium]|nr:DNA primase [Xanthomonadales bacterium]